MIERRAFLAMGATSIALAGAEIGCSAVGPAGTGAGASGAPPPPHGDLEEITIAEIAGRMQRGELTSEALVAAYSERIEAIDRAGPALRSVIELNPDAAAIAKALDDERRAKGARGPLHGVPILVKDNIDTGDRTLTTAGSLALVDAPAPRDAFVVERLRKAGAVILGKANLSEWANIRSDRATSGWSARGGLTRNPYALDRNASGSSSGSAAAVAANLCAAALGTETDGSIVSPSSICGIVGVKPTVGLVSRSGVLPIAPSQDTAGPMARTVADAALLLAAIAGVDPRDAASAQPPSALDPVRALDPGGAKGKRVGVLRGVKRIGAGAERLFEDAIAAMRAAGAVMIDDVSLGDLGLFDEPEMEVLLTEMKASLATYLASRGGPLRTLEDVMKWNAAHADVELRWFAQELFDQALKKGGLDSPTYQTALATCRRLAREQGIDAAIAKHQLDAVMAPTGGVAWVTDLVNGDNYTGSSSAPAAVAGYPSITVPAGAVNGLPFGVSFFGAAWSEPRLLAIAFAFEQQTKARRRPTFPATVDVP